jgi:hypothetical protein
MAKNWLTKKQVLNIGEEDLPLMVLSFNKRSLISFGITYKTTGDYNHFMWACLPGKFASQDWFFREVPMQKYLKHHRLKFWTNPTWTKRQKDILKLRVRAELVKPRWKTRYDFIAIFGHLIGVTGIQIPWTKICSEHAGYLKLIDPRYDLVNPSPEDVNEWLKLHEDYKVYGRFITED